MTDTGKEILQKPQGALSIMTEEEKNRMMDFVDGFVYALRPTQSTQTPAA